MRHVYAAFDAVSFVAVNANIIVAPCADFSADVGAEFSVVVTIDRADSRICSDFYADRGDISIREYFFADRADTRICANFSSECADPFVDICAD